MNKVPEKFCILPFISMETSTMGQPRVCCYNTDIIKHNNKKLNFKTSSLSESFYSDSMDSLRQSFLNNEMPSSCNICWKVEAAGGKSKRLLSNEKFKVFLAKSDHSNPKLRFLDLKLGNICNLKCRICDNSSSSKWANDDLKLDSSESNKKKISDINNKGRWPRQAEKFWEDIKKISEDVYTLYFAGGEPFLIEEHFDFLKQCVHAGYAGKIDILYNTNGTQFPEEAVANIWPYFKKVVIGFSIDGIDNAFEYQRDGAVWEKVKSNIQKFHTARADNKWLETQFCTTVSTLNILDVIDNLKWAEEFNFDTVIINLLHTPKHFCIRNISAERKNYIKSCIESRIEEIHNRDLQKQIQSMINYMMQTDENLSKDCVDNLEKIDKVRNQNWRIALPKLTEILDNE